MCYEELLKKHREETEEHEEQEARIKEGLNDILGQNRQNNRTDEYLNGLYNFFHGRQDDNAEEEDYEEEQDDFCFGFCPEDECDIPNMFRISEIGQDKTENNIFFVHVENPGEKKLTEGQIKEQIHRIMDKRKFGPADVWLDLVEEIDNVFFNDPYTVVLWKDGTKTKVSCCQGDRFDKMQGLAYAVLKRICGNTNAYHELFDRFIDEEE